MPTESSTLDLTELKKLQEYSPVRVVAPWLVLMAASFLGMGIVLEIYGENSSAFLQAIVGSGLFIGALGAVIAGYKAISKTNALITQFALTNNFKLLDEQALAALLPQSLSNLGHSRKFTHGYQLKIKSKTVSVFHYQYTEGHGKNRTTYSFGVAVMNLKKSYPHLFLDGSVNGASWRYTGDQKIGLEGDFDKHFKLYAPKESKSVALAILTPDVMQTMINSAANYDVEIFDKTVSFISNKTFYGYSQFQALEKCINSMSEELDHKEVSWRPVNSLDGGPMKLKRRNFTKFVAAGVALYILAQFVSALIGQYFNHN